MPWDYEKYPQLQTAVVLANGENGKKVAPVYTRAWFDTANLKSQRVSPIRSVDLSGLSGENLINMCVMFQYCGNLTSVTFPAPFDTSKVTDMSYMFNYCEKLQSVNTEAFTDTSNVTEILWMFDHCLALEKADVSKFNVSKVTNLQRVFEYCNSLKVIDVSRWDTSNVTNMDRLFGNCWAVKELDVSKWNTSKVENMQRMFESCHSLTSLDVSNWDTSHVKTMYRMFAYNNQLKTVDVSRFNTSNVTNMKNMFFHALKLDPIDVSHFDTSKVEDMSGMFSQDSWDKSQIPKTVVLFPEFRGETGSMLTGERSSLPKGSVVYAVETLPESIQHDEKKIALAITNGGSFARGTAFSVEKLSEPQKAGFAFDGWYTTRDFQPDTRVTGNQVAKKEETYFTYYAKWEPKDPVTLTLDANGHGASTTQSVPYNGVPAEPQVPSVDGWIFGGWYTDLACTEPFDFSIPMTENATAFAKWTKAEPVPTSTPVAPPKTGDRTPLQLWYVLLAAVCMGMIATIRVHVRQKKG